MLKKIITYTDFNDQERTDEFFFNISKAELLELEFSVAGQVSELLKKIIASRDTVKIMEWFTKFIRLSYGEKSADGIKFIKSKELTEGFIQTNAYSELMTEFMTDPTKAVEFINGVIPQKLRKRSAGIPGA